MLLTLAALVTLALLVLYALSGRPQDPAALAALAALERKLHLLVHHLQGAHPDDPRTHRLAYGWDGRLSELRGLGAGTTVNKRAVSVCVRNAAGTLEDPMTGFMVVAHEAAHVCSESQGHTAEFWSNFRFLLKEAVAAGLYEYQNFEQAAATYCGSTIAWSPLTCLRDGTCS